MAQRVVRREGDGRELGVVARIDDLGDLRVHGALETIDATGLTVTPAFQDGVEAGATMQLPDWSARPATATIAVGQPAHLFLLESDDAIGTYRVVRVLRIGQVSEAPPARH